MGQLQESWRHLQSSDNPLQPQKVFDPQQVQRPSGDLGQDSPPAPSHPPLSTEQVCP